MNVVFGPEFELTSTKGCEVCGGSGYKGRVGLHELLVVNDDIRAAIGQKAPVDKLRALSKQTGMTRLLQDGVRKVLQGITDLKQALAVCSR